MGSLKPYSKILDSSSNTHCDIASSSPIADVSSCHPTQITSVLDGNVVYSNEPAKLDDLRSYEGGLMKTLPVFR